MNSPIESFLIGRVLADRYRVEALVGRGGMSLVYRATDQRLDRPVALKVVSLPAADEGERATLRQRLRREAASAARIPPHPNVVQVYDHGTDPELDLDFIVMELIRGRDVRDLLKEGAPPPDEAFRILLEAARGVAAGHRAGIVHRDVKPGNIVLGGDAEIESVKILDFGIAKALAAEPGDDLTRTGHTPHSPAYASPEQLRGERDLTAASDVFQLGLVGFELRTGRRPLGAEQRERLRDGARSDPIPTEGWDSLPPGLAEVIRRALRMDPAERFPDAGAFAEALAAARDGAAPAPEEDGVAVAATRTLGSHDATLLGAGRPAVAAAPAAAVPRARSGTGPARGISGRAAAGAGVALLLLLAWVVTRGGGATAEAPATEASLDVDALDEEFRPLMVEAYRNLLEEESPVQGTEAAAAVQRVIQDLTEAFVNGDLERHLAHYASRVEYRGSRRVQRSRIERERRGELERYPARSVTLERQAIEFPEPGAARALVDRSWDYRGEEESWSGEARQELRLELRDGRWLVVAERDLEVFRSDRG
jgi:hypothetical protein